MMLFPGDRAREVLQAWREWTATAPDSATTSARILQVPDCPSCPRSCAAATSSWSTAPSSRTRTGRRILAPLRALGPEIDTFADIPPVGLSRIHMDPEDPDARHERLEMLDSLTAETSTRWSTPLARARARADDGRAPPPRRRAGPHAGGALSRFDGEYLYFAAGAALSPELIAALEASMASSPTRSPPPLRQALPELRREAHRPGGVLRRRGLRPPAAVKAEVDPLELFRGNHEITARV